VYATAFILKYMDGRTVYYMPEGVRLALNTCVPRHEVFLWGQKVVVSEFHMDHHVGMPPKRPQADLSKLIEAQKDQLIVASANQVLEKNRC
jgi:hypothetical protein